MNDMQDDGVASLAMQEPKRFRMADGQQVVLPLVFEPRTATWLKVVGPPLLLIGGAYALLGAPHVSTWDAIINVGVGIFFTALGSLAAISYLNEASMKRQIITIGEDGFGETRYGIGPVRWEDVEKVRPFGMNSVVMLDIFPRTGIDTTRWPKELALLSPKVARLRITLMANKRNLLVAKLIVELHERAQGNDPSAQKRRQVADATGRGRS